MVHSKNPKNSEVDAYSYIRNELEKLGWNIKNPARVPEGEVYKQNEGLYNLEIKAMLDRDMPEAIIKLNECDFWVIESKRDKKDIEKALDEAKNQYAKKINKSKKINCIIITGVAGNDTDGYTVINQYLHEKEWKTILFNGKAKDTLLSKEQTIYLLNNKTPNWQEFPDFPEEKYLSSAETINEILHNAGVNKNKRARFIAGLVLSLSLNEEINLRTENTTTLVKNINTLIEQKLSEVNKENFYNYIKLEVPPSKENHIKYRRAIIDTLKELQTLDIKNAMASGNDVLGKFYEKFLKYGNGAKEIGIVLTPRHITEFAVDVLDVKNNDYVLDPTCGTGGFLVSAFDHVKKNSNDTQIDKFKNYNLFGIEQDDEVVSLALVNMIFRGDGRNNMSEGNCFQKNILKTNKGQFETGRYEKREGNENKNPLITKVLMNPPFALKKGDEKETHFIDYALSQMEDGGVLFAIVPVSVMFKAPHNNWRKELLKNNTLISVLTFPQDLFYPVGVHTIGIFIRKGISHNFDKNVYFARAKDDGFIKIKGVRIFDKNRQNSINEIRDELKSFVSNSGLKLKSVPEFKAMIKLNEQEKSLELVPEAYLETDYSKFNDEDFIKTVHDYVAFRFSTFNLEDITPNKVSNNVIKLDNKNWKYFKFEEIFKFNSRGQRLIETDREKGDILYFSASEFNNGWTDKISNPLFTEKDALIYTTFGDAYYVQGEFTASDEVSIFKDAKLNVYTGLFLASVISKNKYKYSFGRKAFKNKWSRDLIPLPIDDNDKIDWKFMEDYVKSLPYSKSL